MSTSCKNVVLRVIQLHIQALDRYDSYRSSNNYFETENLISTAREFYNLASQLWGSSAQFEEELKAIKEKTEQKSQACIESVHSIFDSFNSLELFSFDHKLVRTTCSLLKQLERAGEAFESYKSFRTVLASIIGDKIKDSL